APHWMPCPVEGKPGLLVSTILMVESLAMMPRDLARRSGSALTTAMNSWLANQTRPLCCELGDEKMAWLWWIVSIPPERLCRERYPLPGLSVRVCWRPAGHDGDHEWARLARRQPSSIFDLMSEIRPEAP